MTNYSILLVEDDPTSVLLTQRIYQKSGLRAPLLAVADAEEAVAYLTGESPFNQRDRYPLPALVLLDLKLPRMSGHQFLHWLRELDDFKNLPVVVLTTSRDPEDIQRAYDDSANTYLIKPVTVEDLLDLANTFGLLPEQPPRFLLVEDIAVDRELDARALANEFPEAQVVAVQNELEMTRALESAEFDLVVAGYRAGRPESFSILRQVKTRRPNCPSILLLASGDEHAAHLAVKGGWDDVVLRLNGSPGRLAHAAKTQLDLARYRRQLRKAETRYYHLTENMPIGLFRATLRGQIVEANPALRAMLGYGEQPLSTAYILPDLLVNDEARVAWQEGFQQEGALHGFEAQIYGADREILWVEVNAQVVRDAHGNPSFIQGSLEDVSQRKQAETHLRASEEKSRGLIEQSQDGMLLVDETGVIVEWNVRLETLTGIPRQDAMRRYLWEIVEDVLQRTNLDIQLDTYRATLIETLRSGEISPAMRTLEIELAFPGRPSRYLQSLSFPIRTSRGFMIGCAVRDVSERRQVDEALYESERRFRSTLDNVRLIAIALDPDGLITYANDFLLDLIGWRREEVMGQNWFELFIPPDIDIRKDYRAFVETGTISQQFIHHENEILTRQGERRMIHWNNTLLKGSGGACVGMVSIGEDITERKKAEAALVHEQSLMRALLDNSPDFIYFKDDQGRYVRINRAHAEVFGLANEEQAVGLTAEDFLGPEFARRSQEIASQIIQSGEARVNFEEEVNLPGRSTMWVSSTQMPFRDENGRIVGTIGISRDITASKQAELKSRQQAELLELAHDSIFVLDLDECITYWNHGSERLYGFERKEALGKVSYALLQTRFPIRLEEIKQDLYQAGVWEGELLQTRRDGSQIIVASRWSLQRDDEGRPSAILEINNDITERKKHEHELQVIASLSSALRSAETRASMAPVILDQMVSLLEADAGSFEIIDIASGESLVEEASGAWAAATGARIPLGNGLNSYILSSGRPYLSNKVLKDPRVVMADLYGDCQAAAGAPMIAQGQMIGFLWIGRKTRFSENEVQLLAAIADIAANAIHRADLHEQSERSVQRLAALHEIDTAISSSLDLHITLRVLLEQVITQLHVDAADVLLLNGVTPQLHYAAGRGFKTRLLEKSTVRVGEGFAGQAALLRNTVEIPDLDASDDGSSIYKILASEGFHSYFAVPLFAKGQVTGVLEVHLRSHFIPDQDWLDFLHTLGGQAAIAIDNATLFNDLQRLASDLIMAYDETIEGWSRALDLRDKETEGHTLRVAEMTEILARKMGVGDAELVHIRRGALLHDIGKMGVPDAILLKPGKLTDEEWERMRKHPVYAYELLYPIRYLRSALDIPYCHHEKWDGTGYPRGLHGEQIPLAARLFALVDVWDALSYPRPYRPEAWPSEKIRAYMQELSGTHFDPQVVRAFLSLLDDK